MQARGNRMTISDEELQGYESWIGREQVTTCVIAPESADLMAATLDRDADGALIRKAGIMAVVLEGGEVFPGDAIGVALPAGPHHALKPV